MRSWRGWLNTVAGGDLAREAHLVRDHQHRHPVGGEPFHHLQHLAGQLEAPGAEQAAGLVDSMRGVAPPG